MRVLLACNDSKTEKQLKHAYLVKAVLSADCSHKKSTGKMLAIVIKPLGLRSKDGFLVLLYLPSKKTTEALTYNASLLTLYKLIMPHICFSKAY